MMKFSPTPKVASEIGQTMGGSLARFVGLGIGWEGGHFPAPRRPSSPPRPQAQAWRSNGAVGAKNAKMKMTEEGRTGAAGPDGNGMPCERVHKWQAIMAWQLQNRANQHHW